MVLSLVPHKHSRHVFRNATEGDSFWGQMASGSDSSLHMGSSGVLKLGTELGESPHVPWSHIFVGGEAQASAL